MLSGGGHEEANPRIIVTDLMCLHDFIDNRLQLIWK